MDGYDKSQLTDDNMHLCKECKRGEQCQYCECNCVVPKYSDNGYSYESCVNPVSWKDRFIANIRSGLSLEKETDEFFDSACAVF